MTENPYLKLVEEFKDAISENDLLEYKRDRASYATRIFFGILGFLLTATIAWADAALKFGVSISVGVTGVFLGFLILYTVVRAGRNFFPAIHGEYRNYLEAKRKIKEISRN